MAKRKIKEVEDDLTAEQEALDKENIIKEILSTEEENNNYRFVYLQSEQPSTMVEFTARYLKEEEGIDELRDLGIDVKSKKEYEYDLFTIDLHDIHCINRITDGNTFIRMRDGITVWYVKLRYEIFKKVYEKVLNRKIYTVNDLI